MYPAFKSSSSWCLDLKLYKTTYKFVGRSLWCVFCIFLTGDGQGDVLADDKLFSTSSGNSTEPVRGARACRSFLCVDGLDGADCKSFVLNLKKRLL